MKTALKNQGLTKKCLEEPTRTFNVADMYVTLKGQDKTKIELPDDMVVYRPLAAELPILKVKQPAKYGLKSIYERKSNCFS